MMHSLECYSSVSKSKLVLRFDVDYFFQYSQETLGNKEIELHLSKPFLRSISKRNPRNRKAKPLHHETPFHGKCQTFVYSQCKNQEIIWLDVTMDDLTTVHVLHD